MDAEEKADKDAVDMDADVAIKEADAAVKEAPRAVLAMSRKRPAVRKSQQARRSPVNAAKNHQPPLTKIDEQLQLNKNIKETNDSVSFFVFRLTR